MNTTSQGDRKWRKLMIRRIIKIKEELCTGCGICADACHEGAIGIVNGKAKLLRENYCDGLGDCLPTCPTGAISFEEREAQAYDEDAVKKHQMLSMSIKSKLNQWPVQIKLVPVNAAFFHKAHILVAADCTAYAYANFHKDFMNDKITLIGCPKLDQGNYADKLTQIIAQNDVESITVVRMEVPCCGGIEQAVKTALINSGKCIPCAVVTISVDGTILKS